jgi:hypothetical protein
MFVEALMLYYDTALYINKVDVYYLKCNTYGKCNSKRGS